MRCRVHSVVLKKQIYRQLLIKKEPKQIKQNWTIYFKNKILNCLQNLESFYMLHFSTLVNLNYNYKLK